MLACKELCPLRRGWCKLAKMFQHFNKIDISIWAFIFNNLIKLLSTWAINLITLLEFTWVKNDATPVRILHLNDKKIKPTQNPIRDAVN